jgi:hypothetical protein
MYSIYLLKPLLNFELYSTDELEANQQEDGEVYYEERDLSGGIDYIIKYRVNCEDNDDEV